MAPLRDARRGRAHAHKELRLRAHACEGGQDGGGLRAAMAGMARRLLCRGFCAPAGPPSTRQLREADEAAPVFQYAGKAARRKDRVFVWGFSYSGALGIPSFVKPDAGWKKPRRIQPTPYRLETEDKVGPARSGGASVSPRPLEPAQGLAQPRNWIGFKGFAVIQCFLSI